MSADSDVETDVLDNVEEIIEGFSVIAHLKYVIKNLYLQHFNYIFILINIWVY